MQSLPLFESHVPSAYIVTEIPVLDLAVSVGMEEWTALSTAEILAFFLSALVVSSLHITLCNANLKSS